MKRNLNCSNTSPSRVPYSKLNPSPGFPLLRSCLEKAYIKCTVNSNRPRHCQVSRIFTQLTHAHIPFICIFSTCLLGQLFMVRKWQFSWQFSSSHNLPTNSKNFICSKDMMIHQPQIFRKDFQKNHQRSQCFLAISSMDPNPLSSGVATSGASIILASAHIET